MVDLHTPGPWTDDEGGFLGADGRPVGQPERGKPLLGEVARVQADRRLMRLAPALLHAARALLDCAELNLDHMEPETRDAIQQAEAVVALVEGMADA